MQAERRDRSSEFPSFLGPYQLEYLLGQGGMGKVFAAVHTKTGQSVALKTVLSRRLSTVAALHQEISILSRIQHPGVIRLRETGTEDGIPWYAMDAVQGPSLRDVMAARADAKNAPHSPIALTSATTGMTMTGGFLRCESGVQSSHGARWGAGVRRQEPIRVLKEYLGENDSHFADLFAQLSAAVAHLHRQGVRHGDLKPENVLLMGIARPLLVDLGVASYSIAGREKLDLNPGNAGSVAYMAPEQLSDGHVDTRSDLYSLGCMMYEWLSGKHPCASSEGRTMRSAHLEYVPTRLKLLVPDLPAPLESLVMRLIEKDPKDRPARIEEILANLEGQGTSAYQVEISSTAPPLFRSPFYGRTKDLQALNERLSSAQDGQGSLTRVCGEQGIGKTRLLNELGNLASARDFIVLLLKKEHVGEHALANFLPQLVASFDEDETPLPPSAESALLGLKTASEESALALERNQNLRESVLSGVADAVHLRALSKPILLLVDDMEEIDELAQELIERLGRRATDNHLAIVCAQRAFEGPSDEVLRLSSLEPSDIAEIAHCMLSTDSLPIGFQEFLQLRSMGNPMLVAEWLRSAIFEEILSYRPGVGWSVREMMPQELGNVVSAPFVQAELAKKRLTGLAPASYRIAEIASILGSCFSQDLLASLNASKEYHRALGVLLLAGVLELTDFGWLRFADPSLAETLRSRVSEAEQLRLHTEAANWLEVRVDGTPQLAEEYAEHLVQGNRASAALPFFKLAAQLAARNLKFRSSERLYQRALKILVEFPGSCDRKSTARLNETLGDIAGRLKHGSLATEAFTAALELAADAPLSRARLERKLAAVCQSNRELARQHLGRAERALAACSREENKWRFEWIEIQLTKMLNSYFEGNLTTLLEQAVSLAPTVQQYGTPRQFGLFLSQRAAANMRSSRYRTSSAISDDLDQALELQVSGQDHQGAAMTRFLICLNGLCSLGQRGASLQLVRQGFERAMTVGRERDDVVLQMRASAYLGMTLRRQGEVGACGRLSTSLLALEEEHPDSDYRGAALANLAWVSYRSGDFERSRDLALNAFQVWESADSRFPFQWLALCPLLGALLGGQQEKGLTEQERQMVRGFLGDSMQCWLPDEVSIALGRLAGVGEDSRALPDLIHTVENYGLL